MGVAPFARAALLAVGLCAVGATPRASADPWRPWAPHDAWGRRLQHSDPAVRRAALWALSLREAPRGAGSARLVAQLGALAQRDRDPGVAAAAVFVLAQFESPEGRAALRDVAAAELAPREVRAAALRALALTTEAPALDTLLREARAGTLPLLGDDVVQVAERTIADLPDTALAALVAAANPSTGESTGRGGVLRALGLRGDPRWTPLLAEALQTTHRRTASLAVVAALESVARLRLSELGPSVVALARGDRDVTVRRAAVRALGALGGGFDPGVLRALLDDATVRDVALASLGSLGDVGAITAIAALLDAPWSADRIAAAEALGALGAAAGLRALTARVEREADRDVRRALWRAVARIGGAAARDALQTSDEDVARWSLVELLARDPALAAAATGGDDAPGLALAGVTGSPRLAALGEGGPGRRVAAALGVGLAPGGDLPRVEALGAALAHESHEGVRVALVRALADLAAQETAAPSARGDACDLLLGLVEREGDELSLAATVALAALGELHVAAARPAVLRVAAASPASPLLRRVALRAAGQLGARGARWIAARALVSDPDVGVRAAAAVTLRALLGDGADGLLRAVSRASGSPELIDRIAAAPGAVGFAGTASLRSSGALPATVWTVTLPDGGAVFGVATDDGEVWLRGAPEGVASALSPFELQ